MWSNRHQKVNPLRTWVEPPSGGFFFSGYKKEFEVCFVVANNDLTDNRSV